MFGRKYRWKELGYVSAEAVSTHRDHCEIVSISEYLPNGWGGRDRWRFVTAKFWYYGSTRQFWALFSSFTRSSLDGMLEYDQFTDKAPVVFNHGYDGPSCFRTDHPDQGIYVIHHVSRGPLAVPYDRIVAKEEIPPNLRWFMRLIPPDEEIPEKPSWGVGGPP
jgi:hypothetical protein